MAKSTSARSCGAFTAEMSRLPVISGTVEHTTFALAIFSRTGRSGSPEAAGSRKMPPMRSRLSLNAPRSDGGRLSSNS